jgi:hypothetical protein
MKAPRTSSWARRRGVPPRSGGAGHRGGDGPGGRGGDGASGPHDGLSRGQLVLGFAIVPLAFLSIPFLPVAVMLFFGAVTRLW